MRRKTHHSRFTSRWKHLNLNHPPLKPEPEPEPETVVKADIGEEEPAAEPEEDPDIASVEDILHRARIGVDFAYLSWSKGNQGLGNIFYLDAIEAIFRTGARRSIRGGE